MPCRERFYGGVEVWGDWLDTDMVADDEFSVLNAARGVTASTAQLQLGDQLLSELRRRCGCRGHEPTLRARMRQGVNSVLRQLSAVGPVSGNSLVALMCAAALAPVVVAGVAVGPVLLASMGVVGSVGAGVLTDVVQGAVDKLRSNGKEISKESVESELATRLEAALEREGDAAAALRETVAGILRIADATAALLEAAEHDRRLLTLVMDGLVGLGKEFGEFAFAVDDVRRTVWAVERTLRQQQVVLRAEQERAREDGLTLLRVLAAVERSKGISPRPGVQLGGDGAWPGNPYVGLVPFTERDSRVFYGRSELTGHLVQRLGERLGTGGILLVVGASGAGKSSLLQAGVMPRLAAGALGPGSQRWPRRVMRPTATPLRALAIALSDISPVDPVTMCQLLSNAPGKASLLVEQAVRAITGPDFEAMRHAPEDESAVLLPRLVLVVDQFEELFTAGEDTEAGRAEQEAFITAIHAAATVPFHAWGVPAALVVAVVRADFLDRVIAFPPLKEAVDAGPFAVGPMSEAELRLAITGPAAEAGVSVEPALVNAVASDLRGEGAEGGLGSGVLPLVSQAMATTWEYEGNELSLRVYRRAGGVADAVNRAADATFKALTSGQQDAARFVFSRLTIITSDQRLARRQCSRADLHIPGSLASAADVNAVIDTFAARRLLVLGGNTVEICHDVLLHAWKQLRTWLDGDRSDRALYSQVITDAQTWDNNGRDPAYLYQAAACHDRCCQHTLGRHAQPLPIVACHN